MTPDTGTDGKVYPIAKVKMLLDALAAEAASIDKALDALHHNISTEPGQAAEMMIRTKTTASAFGASFALPWEPNRRNHVRLSVWPRT